MLERCDFIVRSVSFQPSFFIDVRVTTGSPDSEGKKKKNYKDLPMYGNLGNKLKKIFTRKSSQHTRSEKVTTTITYNFFIGNFCV